MSKIDHKENPSKERAIEIKNIPKASNITKGFGSISYADVYQINRTIDDSFDQITIDIFTPSALGSRLLKLRDFLMRPFGLKTTEWDEGVFASYYPPGSKLMFFDVLSRTDNEIILGGDDKHLNFRTSVLLDKEVSAVYSITVIHFNNIFGNIYLAVIKPFHRYLVRTSLDRALKLYKSR